MGFAAQPLQWAVFCGIPRDLRGRCQYALIEGLRETDEAHGYENLSMVSWMIRGTAADGIEDSSLWWGS